MAAQRETENSSIASVPEVAVRLKVSRTTVYDWVDKNVLLASRSTKRGLSIPVVQILGPGRMVPGLADIADAVGDPELAWAILTQEWPFEDTAMPLLDLLTAGRTEEVVGVAHEFGASFL